MDERLSTTVVEKMLISADISRNKRKKNIDKLAASYILQGFLDLASKLKSHKRVIIDSLNIHF